VSAEVACPRASSASTQPASSLADETTLRFKVLRSGATFLKHCRNGKTVERRVCITRQMHQLQNISR
jgi:hypothetical protein